MKTLSTFLDLLFPPRKTEKLVRNMGVNKLSLYKGARHYKNTVYLLDYQHPSVRALISENKFYQNTNATKALGAVLQTWVAEQEKRVIFIPIPLSKKRQKKRGYNQITAVLKRVQASDMQIADILVRTKHTPPQTELTRAERLQNIKGAFSTINKVTALDDHTLYVLTDDVVTTESTINEARATLAPHIPPNSTLLTLALAH